MGLELHSEDQSSLCGAISALHLYNVIILKGIISPLRGIMSKCVCSLNCVTGVGTSLRGAGLIRNQRYQVEYYIPQ